MMDLYGLRDDVVEIVARVILHKDEQARGIANPDTDKWAELYGGNMMYTSKPERVSEIKSNIFRAEVDGTVALIMRSVQTRSVQTRSNQR